MKPEHMKLLRDRFWRLNNLYFITDILLEYSGEELQRNSLIKQGDKKLKIAAQGLAWVPGLLDTIAAQGRTWSIIPPLKEINPVGTPILFELQVRS